MKSLINQIKEISVNKSEELNGYIISKRNKNICRVSKFDEVLFEGNQVEVAQYLSKDRNDTLNSFSQSEIEVLVKATGRDKRTILLDIEDSRISAEIYRARLTQVNS
ncbi:hypothetical protein MF621_004034 (plasmid) [Bacillus velezensis]|uniref:hypothetical protein n=1 Tax=Bacillus velezensis TaxID=492670 RepID=UPI000A61008B|nr:hypothetical protein [Bacillus velezensis]URJ76328.1 hypothetical protein MF619_004072 [Bacillus velezensis]URJ80448.1 hypothetical protein MF621_004034 [Bacillus velezensis]